MEGMRMLPGFPLTKTEKAHVLHHVTQAITSQGEAPKGMYQNTPDFLRVLGWPQRRQPDLRDFLESEEAQDLLSKAFNRPVSSFVSRTQVSVSFDRPRLDRQKPVETGVLFQVEKKGDWVFLHTTRFTTDGAPPVTTTLKMSMGVALDLGDHLLSLETESVEKPDDFPEFPPITPDE